MLVSPAYLPRRPTRSSGTSVAPRVYYALLYAFWAILLAVPLAGNLGAAWLLVEATTAASALLVGFSGKPRALEAGWKYLILTSLGLGVALLGIVTARGGNPGRRARRALLARALGLRAGRETALVAYLLLLAGLAAKIGWAPVHNWLPDAHSEAPPPVSALLSAALLPAVLLVAWRSEQALAPVVGESTARGADRLRSRSRSPSRCRSSGARCAWKRLLAYSSLEHMGVIALGIGFGTPLALAGVAVHIAGHAVAKALGFYAATPLLAHEPRAAGHAVTGIARTQPRARHDARHLARRARRPAPLAALRQRGADRRRRVRGRAAMGGRCVRVLLALGFLGLAHALIETTGRASAAARRASRARPARRASCYGAVAVRPAARAHRLRRLAAGQRHRRRARPRGSDDARYRARVAPALARRAGASPACTRRGRHASARCSSHADGDDPPRNVAVEDGRVPTIVDLAPAADWDEREAPTCTA